MPVSITQKKSNMLKVVTGNGWGGVLSKLDDFLANISLANYVTSQHNWILQE